MKLYHTSDTHGWESDVKIPYGVDMIVHSGDATNYRREAFNFNEMTIFMEWYASLDIKYKIYVAGNHDSSVESRMYTKDMFKDHGIIYLEDEWMSINGIMFYGTPWTPTFGNWSFMKNRGKLQPIYDNIHQDTQVLITHGPPRGILDLSYNRDDVLEFCGCKELRNTIEKLKSLRLSLFGHIHDYKDIRNNGVVLRDEVYYSNGTGVVDAKYEYGLVHQGHLFDIETSHTGLIVTPAKCYFKES